MAAMMDSKVSTPSGSWDLLTAIGITPSAESIDYITTKSQFHLHQLTTEQRHPKTWNLSQTIAKSCQAGVEALLSVDDDITARLAALVADEKAMSSMNRMVTAVESALADGRSIYVYGCGATGRLAKQMESNFWRPFFVKLESIDNGALYNKVARAAGWKRRVVDQLIGEMTGADRALISSLEGFEDLQLIGRMQLADHKIGTGSVVICVTEGGETSSVIGTVLAALDDWKKDAAMATTGGTGGVYDPLHTANHLFFVYNNPDNVLLPFIRSRTVIDEPGITKINLTTGPQGITGSTRMQATSSETFVVASILQQAVEQFLRRSSLSLTSDELTAIGFTSTTPITLSQRLSQFDYIVTQVKAASSSIGRFTEMESDAYHNGRRATYFTDDKGLVTVFIDGTERSPTFRLFPLDTIREPARKCWFQVWTPATDAKAAWTAVLGRPFKGLSRDMYHIPFDTLVDDTYLHAAALRSLENAGDAQQHLYDFSFADWNIRHRGPEQVTISDTTTTTSSSGTASGGNSVIASCHELAVVVLIDPRDSDITDASSSYRRFIDLFHRAGTSIALIIVGAAPITHIQSLVATIPGFTAAAASSPSSLTGARHVLVPLQVSASNDPMHIAPLIALKLLLNAHSTSVMTRLGKVVGNTMINVSPSNLKLIGRATSLILTHVNDVIPRIHRAAGTPVIDGAYVSYAHANACLYEMIRYLNEKKAAEATNTATTVTSSSSSIPSVVAAPVLGQTAEVAITIIWIIEAARNNGVISTASHALEINNTIGLAKYLASF